MLPLQITAKTDISVRYFVNSQIEVNVILKWFKQFFGSQLKSIPLTSHGIAEKNISLNALKVLKRLHDSGFEAYLVGGCVRDLLVDLKPKDFDVATNALPEEVRKLFRNSRLIGRRFQLVHVFFKDGIVEVATFRAHKANSPTERRFTEKGMLLSDNIFGCIEEDAWRRDFTVNAMYYKYDTRTILDYTSGLSDIERKTIRVIGDAVRRYHEDPVRMIRAVRLAAKLNFSIEEQSERPIYELSGLLLSVPSARLLEEIIKLYSHGKSVKGFELLRNHGLFAVLFPQTESTLINHEGTYSRFLSTAFERADERVANGKNLHPAFLFAVLLWPPIKKHLDELKEKHRSIFYCLNTAVDKVLHQQNKTLQITRRFIAIMREIWLLQLRLERYKLYSQRIYALFFHPRFRAAYDFLVIRAGADETLKEAADWWTHFQQVQEKEREAMIQKISRRREKK